MDQRIDTEHRLETAPGRRQRSPRSAKRGQTVRGSSAHAPRARRMVLIITALIIVAIVGPVLWWLNCRGYESTDDAFIDARTVSVSAQVGAAIVDVPVTDNQLVEAGAVLVRLDDRDFRAQVDQATAQIDQAKANIANVDAQVAAQQARIDQAEKQTAQSQAALTFAQAARRALHAAGQNRRRHRRAGAAIHLQSPARRRPASRPRKPTRSRPKSSFRSSRRSAKLARGAIGTGARRAGAGRGQSVAHLDHRAGRRPRHATDRSQGQLRRGRPGTDDVRAARGLGHGQFQGDAASLRAARAIRSRSRSTPIRTAQFKGHVDSIQAGSGTAFSLLPAENATGNYVKIVQRVPVKIVFDEPPDVLLGPGMSVVPTVRCDERSAHRLLRSREPLGRGRSQSVADRHRRLDRHLHGRARHRDRQRVAALHRRQPGGQRRREHLGRHHLSDRQRRRSADQRLALQRDRPQALLHALRRGVHGRFAALRARRAASAR